MKLSILKKMALLLTGATAFATPSFGYTAGDIPGTTGSGTEADPVIVDSYGELKAALEHTDIQYVTLADVSEENGYVAVSEPNAQGAYFGINQVGTKNLNIVGDAIFVPDPDYQLVVAFINVQGTLTVGGEGRITYKGFSNDESCWNTIFWVGTAGADLTINSGNYFSTYYSRFTSVRSGILYANSGSVTINGGDFKSESNDGGMGFAVRFEGLARFNINGGVFEKGGTKLTNKDAALSIQKGFGMVTGGTFKSDGVVASIYSGSSLGLKAYVAGEIFSESEELLSTEESKYYQTVMIKLPSVDVSATEGGSANVTSVDGNVVKVNAVTKSDEFVFTGWVKAADETDTISFDATLNYDRSENEAIVATFAKADTLGVWRNTVFNVHVVLPSKPVAGGALIIPQLEESGIQIKSYSWWRITNKYEALENADVYSSDANVLYYKLKIELYREDNSLNFSTTPKAKIFVDGEEVSVYYLSSYDDIYGGAVVEYATNEISFVDEDGVLLDKQIVRAGTKPNAIEPSISSEEYDYFYNFIPEITTATENTTYKAVLDRVAKNAHDINLTTTVVGNSVALSANSPCVLLDYSNVTTASQVYYYDAGWPSSMVLTNGKYKMTFSVKVALDQCPEDDFVKSIRLNGLTYADVYIDGVKQRYPSAIGKTSSVVWTSYSYDFIVGPVYEITFLDAEGIQIGEILKVTENEVPDAPTDGLTPDDEVYHYYYEWDSPIIATTKNTTYKIVGERRFKKDYSVYLTMSYYVGEKLSIAPADGDPCINIQPLALAKMLDDDYDYVSEDEKLIQAQYIYAARVIINSTGECAENPKLLAWKYSKATTIPIFINGKFVINILNGKSQSVEYEFYASNRTDFGAVTIAADRSSATIDGTSDIAVADMDGIEVTGDVTLNRSYAAGKYSTVMLPFATSASNVPGVSFYGLHDVVKKDGEWQVQVSPVSEIQANTPYIVVASGDASNLVVTGGVTFNTTTGTKSSTAGDWQFVGTYEFKNWDEDHNAEEIGTTYGFAGAEGDNDGVSIGTFGKVKAGARIYPLRAYLRYVPVVSPKPAPVLAKSRAVAGIDDLPESMDVVIVGGDSGEETTVIGTINTRTGEFRNAGDRWFDLKGRFLGVKRPAIKGTYYNNGKKVIVK